VFAENPAGTTNNVSHAWQRPETNAVAGNIRTRNMINVIHASLATYAGALVECTCQKILTVHANALANLLMIYINYYSTK
jgi:hypothetical protein